MTAAYPPCKVVGMVAGGRGHVVAAVNLHDPVLLLPQPDNPYDRHAVAVYTLPAAVCRGAVLSSIRDPDRIGELDPDDRVAILDRQAGYLPAPFAARLSLPSAGVVGYVSDVRYPPPSDEPGRVYPVGFDVTAAWHWSHDG